MIRLSSTCSTVVFMLCFCFHRLLFRCCLCYSVELCFTVELFGCAVFICPCYLVVEFICSVDFMLLSCSVLLSFAVDVVFIDRVMLLMLLLLCY